MRCPGKRERSCLRKERMGAAEGVGAAPANEKMDGSEFIMKSDPCPGGAPDRAPWTRVGIRAVVGEARQTSVARTQPGSSRTTGLQRPRRIL